ncbi:hypothetical protein LY76DRAFT_410968 [Colletotrichum caudatum]|nr:hypothetical protein LY76DRAFT_410968 [Colletotrichum caudatum]
MGSTRPRSPSAASSVKPGYTTPHVGVPPPFTPSAGNISRQPTRAAVEPTLDYPAPQCRAACLPYLSHAELSNDGVHVIAGRQHSLARHRCPAQIEYGRKTSLFTTLSGSSRRRPLPEIVRTADGTTGQNRWATDSTLSCHRARGEVRAAGSPQSMTVDWGEVEAVYHRFTHLLKLRQRFYCRDLGVMPFLTLVIFALG